MSARNIYHDAVVAALIADGWNITDDPLRVTYGGRDLYVDLAAEKPVIGAEKEGKRIGVEIQSFLSRSPVHDLELAVGQYQIYRLGLAEADPTRTLYMAVPGHVYETFFSERFGQSITEQLAIRLLIRVLI